MALPMVSSQGITAEQGLPSIPPVFAECLLCAKHYCGNLGFSSEMIVHDIRERMGTGKHRALKTTEGAGLPL